MSAELKQVHIELASDNPAAQVPPGATGDAMPTPRRQIRLGLGLLVLAAAAVGLWQWAKPAKAPDIKRDQPVPVVLDTASRRNLSEFLTGIGTVQAGATAIVRPRIDGQLQAIHFIEGQDVKAGEVLAQLDPRALQAQLAVAEAQLARDQATLANARADLERYAELVKNGSISKQAADTQKALVAQHEATVRADQAAVDYARVQLDYTTVRAPISGRTGVRLLDVGNLARVADANGMVVINQIDVVTITFTLPEAQFARINTAMQHNADKPLRVLAYGNDSRIALAEGKLLLINNQIDTTSGTVQLKAEFNNKQHALWPGQYVNARLVLGEDRNVLVVPASAVQRGPEGTFVYVVNEDQSVKVQPVQVARIQDAQAVLVNGISDGQRVVTEGQSKLRPGSKVIDQEHSTAPQERTP